MWTSSCSKWFGIGGIRTCHGPKLKRQVFVEGTRKFASCDMCESHHDPEALNSLLGGGFIFFNFHPCLGKISNVTNIFQLG